MDQNPACAARRRGVAVVPVGRRSGAEEASPPCGQLTAQHVQTCRQGLEAVHLDDVHRAVRRAADVQFVRRPPLSYAVTVRASSSDGAAATKGALPGGRSALAWRGRRGAAAAAPRWCPGPWPWRSGGRRPPAGSAGRARSGAASGVTATSSDARAAVRRLVRQAESPSERAMPRAARSWASVTAEAVAEWAAAERGVGAGAAPAGAAVRAWAAGQGDEGGGERDASTGVTRSHGDRSSRMRVVSMWGDALSDRGAGWSGNAVEPDLASMRVDSAAHGDLDMSCAQDRPIRVVS